MSITKVSKFNLDLKVESKGYNYWCATNVCEFVKIAKFANINRARTFVDLQYIDLGAQSCLVTVNQPNFLCFCHFWVTLGDFSYMTLFTWCLTAKFAKLWILYPLRSRGMKTNSVQIHLWPLPSRFAHQIPEWDHNSGLCLVLPAFYNNTAFCGISLNMVLN